MARVLGPLSNTSGNRSCTGLFQPIVGRGSAYADIDGDGDLGHRDAPD